ncbi:YidC/Oxa1 family membrane protein insertase [Flintibacter muris]|uniref:YidC/Oxa1 family membrane protein insertase n=1 Tax=Flintibacter muris TaxID=2941327 RepID=UPI00203C402E|nr:YidC/Oxa1 family membrane protein insertase [Flintibacter muris]
MGIILQPFAWLLLFFYNLFNSYGIALILFGIVIKLVLFPVTLKSKKSMIQTTMLSGKMQQLQKQYGKDKERYNIELQKLYEKEKVNPMGGCVWSLIPMVVLIALFGIIRQPLTYFMGLTADQIQMLATQVNWSEIAVTNGWVTAAAMEKAENLFQEVGYNQLYLVSLIRPENLEALKAAVGADSLFVMNFQFLGIDLSLIPTWRFWTGGMKWSSIGLFILPIISVAVSFLSMKVSMATNQMNKQTENKQMDSTNRMMMWMMPLMSLWIGFTVPAGLSIYWITQYFITMIQEVICGRMLKKDYEAAREAAAKREAEEKEEEKRRKEEARLERQRRIEEEKKNRGKKKPQKKDTEPDQEGVNREDSREGIRAYARGRAYIPNRYGGVTPYTDPNQLFRAVEAAGAGKKDKKKGKSEKTEEGRDPFQAGAIQIPESKPAEPPAPQETKPAPIEAPAETEEVEVEVEEIEVEIDEDENKEG